jgi:uncharacterized protein (DUF2384 family)
MLNRATFKPAPQVSRSVIPGAKPLGLTATNVTQLEQAFTQGLPVTVLKKLIRTTGATLEDIAAVFGLASRVRKREPFTEVQSFKLYRDARVFERAGVVFGSPVAARDWLGKSSFCPRQLHAPRGHGNEHR